MRKHEPIVYLRRPTSEELTTSLGWHNRRMPNLPTELRPIEELRERGVRKLDLGGVNTTRSAGIARFKMSTGGEVLTCAGTFI